MSRNANRREERLLKACGIAYALLGTVTLASCGSHETGTPMEASGAEVKPVSIASDPRLTASENLGARLMRLNQAVTRWQEASSIDAAHEAAEEARNLVVGETGPFYGDADGDGRVSGANPVGVLPGLQGEAGLARPNENVCIDADVLGGSWDRPSMRWSRLQAAIRDWRPQANTFPSLPSHPQRVVGWASLTLGSSSLEDAHEFAGHARLHVDVSRRALHNCRR